MKRKIEYRYVILLIFVMNAISCNKNVQIFYSIDQITGDTIVSYVCSVADEQTAFSSSAKIVVMDSIVDKDDICKVLSNSNIFRLFEFNSEVLDLEFKLYNHKGSFTNYILYNDSNYYLEGRVYVSPIKISETDYDYYISSLQLWENEYEKIKRQSKQEAEELQMKYIKDSLEIVLRDSVSKEFAAKKVKLSFMGYKLGGPFYNSGAPNIATIISSQKILDENIDDVKISHYNNIIYEIRVFLNGYTEKYGIPIYTYDAILELYRRKYGNNYGGCKWAFQNSSITVDSINEDFFDVKKLTDFRSVKSRKSRIKQIVITYFDYDAYSIVDEMRKKDELLLKEKIKEENKRKYQILIDNI